MKRYSGLHGISFYGEGEHRGWALPRSSLNDGRACPTGSKTSTTAANPPSPHTPNLIPYNPIKLAISGIDASTLPRS